MSEETKETVAENSVKPTKNEGGPANATGVPMSIHYLLIAAVFFGLGIFIGAQYLDPGGSSGGSVDEAAIEEVMRDVLFDLRVAERPQEMAALVDDDPFMGPADAPVVIVEFSAYACPYCGRHFQQTFEPLLENYGQYVRYVYRDLPIINSAVSVEASLAAECAHEQDHFWEFHEALFANQQNLSRQFYLDTATNLNLNLAEFTTCLTEQRYLAEIQRDTDDALQIGFNSTPAFVINGYVHNGAQPYAYFENIILEELAKVGIDL